MLAELVTSRSVAEDSLRPISEALHVDANACFDAATLAPNVALQLKRERIDRRVELEIHGDPQGNEGVTIEVRRDGRSAGTRAFPTFTDPCDEILSAMAVAVAMTIDATEHEQQSGSLAVAAPSRPNPEIVQKVQPRRYERAAVGFDMMALWGVLPGFALGIAPNAAYSPLPNFALRVSLLATSRGSLALSGGEVEMRALGGRLDTCGVLYPEGVRLRACAGVTVGSLSAVGQNFVSAKSNGEQQRLLLGGLARVDARIPIVGALGLTAFADLFVRFTDSDVSVSGGDSRSMAPVGALVGVGPELRFW